MVEEERRIAYVGLTRARLGIVVTHVRQRNHDIARPSPFLREMLGTQPYGRSLAATLDPRNGMLRDPEVLVQQPVFRAAEDGGTTLPVPMTRSMLLAGTGTNSPVRARPQPPAGLGEIPSRRVAGGAPLF